VTRHLGGALKTHGNAAKINTAAIGNTVPQLNVHIVARHNDDAARPKTKWRHGYMHSLAETTKAVRLSTIQSWLGKM
jgi:diadenosine tetraphosphate (Ap4A) HIT family hydrolase